MQVKETALAFRCGPDMLYGVLSSPEAPSSRGVLIVVGGPQYRAGSHRQFTLLARTLAAAGTPAMRFDYRGMGDSEGAARDFTDVGADLAAAIDHFFAVQPDLREVVLWGLCDAASAILFYAGGDRRVRGIALLNPWARTEQGIATATLKHYYVRRLLEREFWGKILRGRFNLAESVRSASNLIATSLRGDAARTPTSLPERMRDGFARFDGRVLLMLSGADLTAREFAGLAANSPEWRHLLGRPSVIRKQLPGADHTCSRRVWHDQMTESTEAWLRAW